MDGAGQLDSLLRALNNPDPLVKEAAKRSLLHLGEEILPELERIHLDDPDTRTAVARVVERLRTRRETRMWQQRILSIPDWFGDAWYVFRLHGGPEGRARLAVRPRQNKTLEIEFTQASGSSMRETKLLCRADLFLTPIALSRKVWRGETLIEDRVHFQEGVAVVNGSMPETCKPMPPYFVTELTEMVLAVTMPFLDGFSFAYNSVDTRTWDSRPSQHLEVMGSEVFAVGSTRLTCWRMRHADSRPRSYWVSEDRALVAAIIGDEEYWLSDARSPTTTV
jgi:hypothetical protein